MFDNLVPVAWIVHARSTIGPFVQWRRLVSETGNCAKKGADNRCGPVVVPPVLMDDLHLSADAAFSGSCNE